jgi:peptidoglycan hydrolase CwlO-like protein
MKRRATTTEIILGLLLVANIIFSFYLYRVTTDQEARIKALERNDAITQQVDKLQQKVDELKKKAEELQNKAKGLF